MREAYRSLYGDLTKLKGPSLLDLPDADTVTDDALFQLLLAVSEAVDDYCNRHFYPLALVRRFDGVDGGVLELPDLTSIAALRSDEDGDGVCETQWQPHEYQLLPLNAAPDRPWGHPYTALRTTARSSRALARGHARYEIDGVWGYRAFVDASVSNLDGGVSDLATSLTVDDGARFAVGQTLVMDDEQLLVTAIAGNTLTVRRAINGTAAEVHPDGTPIGVLRWPAPVERAALITAARIWTRAPAFEPFYVDADMDTDVRMFLDPYRRPAV